MLLLVMLLSALQLYVMLRLAMLLCALQLYVMLRFVMLLCALHLYVMLMSALLMLLFWLTALWFALLSAVFRFCCRPCCSLLLRALHPQLTNMRAWPCTQLTNRSAQIDNNKSNISNHSNHRHTTRPHIPIYASMLASMLAVTESEVVVARSLCAIKHARRPRALPQLL